MHSLELRSVVIRAQQQITARNPLLVAMELELNLTVMVPVLLKGPGMEEAVNC